MGHSATVRRCALAPALSAALFLAPTAHAQPATRAAAPALPAAIEDTPGDAATFRIAARGHQPALRGPSGQVIFDSISGCTSFARYSSGPTAILDDLSFAPGPASNAGAVVTGLDFYIRTWGPRERINVRLTFFQTLITEGAGDPPVVQHDIVSQQFLIIEDAPVNTGSPGSFLTVVDLAPFALRGPEFALEIAYTDDDGAILPNGPLSTVFPGNACAAAQPSIGSSREVFWIDNDFGNLTGDGIRYEPAAPSMPGDQGDALQWGGATPADNVLAIRIRGYPIEPTVGACCMNEEPYLCTLLTADACAISGGIFIGFGEPCTPVYLCVPPPPNDECEEATEIAGEGAFPFDTRGASSAGPDDCFVGLPPFGISSDVWFLWTAPCTSEFQLRTCDTDTITDDRLAVYSPDCDIHVSFGCDDDSCPVGFQSWLAFDAIRGDQYLIRVGVYPNTPGGFGEIHISCIVGQCDTLCPADFDQNGTVDVADIFAFLAAWFQQVPAAWFFGGGEGGVPAIMAFLAEWFAQGLGPC